MNCLSAGMRLPLRHPLGFLRQMWHVVLAAFLITALLGDRAAVHFWQFFNMGFADGLTTHDLLGIPLASVLFMVGVNVLIMSVVAGILVYQMKRYAELSYLPSVNPWKNFGRMIPTVRDSAKFSFVAFIVQALLIVVSLLVMPHRAWALALFAVLSLVASYVLSVAGMRYLMSDVSMPASFKWTLSHLRETGGMFATWTVSGLVFVLVTMTGFVPALCCTYVGGMSDMAVLTGDGTDLPGSFVYVRALAFGLGTITESIALLFFIVPLAFSWGAQTAIENEGENGTQE